MSVDKKQMFEVIHSLSAASETYASHIQKQLGFGTNFTPEEKEKGKDKGPGIMHDGHYPFIPTYSISSLVRCLCEVRDYISKRDKISGNPLRLKFLDCGCGIGNIMMLAKRIDGYKSVVGIEYDSATYKVAKELLSQYSDDINDKVIHNDLLDFRGYGKFDVIYYYEPISDVKKRNEFCKKLANNMKAGAVVIANGHSYLFSEDKAERFKHVPTTRCSAYEKVKGDK